MELPTYIQIEPVGQCNLRCRMCPIQFRSDGSPDGPPAFMPLATFRNLIDQFTTLGELHLQGLGEPMMHPQFFEMVRYAAQRGIRVTTNTNMTLLSRRRADLCMSAGLDTIHISVDGANADTYEAIRVQSSFARLSRNMDWLLQARRAAGGGPKLHMVGVLMRRNLHELPALVRLAHHWEMEELFIQHLCHDFGEDGLPARYRPMRDFVSAETLAGVDLAPVDAVFAEARAVAAELGLRLRLPNLRPQPHPPGTRGRERCNWPWSGAYLSYDGQAMPCCMISTPDRGALGNMAEQGVAAVWSGEDYESFRARLDSDNPPEVCRSCALYQGLF
ncbi:MAG: radical SAM protein [Oscillochloris sp.]|nr:radical SAM protein [Oscillochloris sp.]